MLDIFYILFNYIEGVFELSLLTVIINAAFLQFDIEAFILPMRWLLPAILYMLVMDLVVGWYFVYMEPETILLQLLHLVLLNEVLLSLSLSVDESLN